MRTILRHLTSLYLIASALSWFPAGAVGSVLCFEPSGRVAVEQGAAPCCDSVGRSAAPASGVGGMVSDACGPCVDIRLGAPEGRVSHSSARVQPPSQTVHAFPSNPAFDLLPAIPDHAMACVRLPAPRTRSPLNTILLRI
jgi:hypothetical protein